MQVSNLGEAQLNRSSVFLDGLCHISEVNCRSAFEIGWLLFGLKGGDQIKYLSSSGKLTQACSHGGWIEDKESKWKHEVCLKLRLGLTWWFISYIQFIKVSGTRAAQIRGKHIGRRIIVDGFTVYYIFHRHANTLYCYDYVFLPLFL